MSSLVSMKEICSCDIVSFHVPLTENGPYPTISLGNQDFFEALPHQALVVNASRGPVLEGTALHDWLGREQGYAALDVWPDEPAIESSLIHKVTVGTPHVAGYSMEGKLNGTRLIYLGFLDWLGIEHPDPAPPIVAIAEKLPALSAQSVKAAVLAVCPVAEDDKNLRSKAVNQKSISGNDFDQLRKNYPARRDFSGWSLPDECSSPTAEALIKLGFS
jgi:erythronate-4-phosphate dehydrogenase